jgi:hypothetical protein
MPLVRATLAPSVPPIGSTVTLMETRHQLESWVGKDQSVQKKRGRGLRSELLTFEAKHRAGHGQDGVIVHDRCFGSRWPALLEIALAQHRCSWW